MYRYCKDWYYMNHHKTGNPQNLRLYAESKGSTLQVAGSGWSNPVYGIERKWGGAAEPNSASKPSSVVLLVCLGKVGGKGTLQHASQSRGSLFHLPASQDEKTCFAHLVSPDLTEQLCSCWDVSSWDRCLIQGTLRSFICLCANHVLRMCQGRYLPFRASLLWCHSVLLPMWSYPLMTGEYVSHNICLKSTDTSFPV